MNFVRLTRNDGKSTLVNMDNVIDIHPNQNNGSTLYCVTSTRDDQIELEIKETIDQLAAFLNAPNV